MVQSNIVAEDNTYPTNGRHTDGFWYVKGAAVTTLPGQIIDGVAKPTSNPVLPNSQKLVRMPNGWYVHIAVLNSGANALSVSKDNGVKWELVREFTASVTGVALVVIGDDVGIFYHSSTASLFVKYTPATNVFGTVKTIFTGPLISPNSVSAHYDKANNRLYVAYSVKNNNSYNLAAQYSIDRGDSFSGLYYGTSYNSSTQNVTSPVAKVADSTAYFAFQLIDNGNHSILMAKSTTKNSITFSLSNNVVANIGSKGLSGYSLAVGPDNRMYLAFSTNDVGLGILLSNNLGSWSFASKPPAAANLKVYFPHITVDGSGNVRIVAHSMVAPYEVYMFSSANYGVDWDSNSLFVANTALYPNVLQDESFKSVFAPNIVVPLVYRRSDTGSLIFKGSLTTNKAPSVTLISPENNQTLYENDTINISGDAYDADKDQSVTVFYQINGEQRKVLATNVSQTQITLSKQLTFKNGKLYDGETVLTETLAEGVEHKIKVWAVDSENEQSATVERTFYVIPNRAPVLSIDAVVPSGIINTDKFKISGITSDQDANSTLTVNYRINGANPVEIYTGTGGAWEFEILLNQLKVGENLVVVEVADNYNAKTSKTIKLNKNEVKTPILQSVARYKIEPPKGSAKGVLLWIQRDEGLDLKVEVSMTLKGEQESYEQLTANHIAPVYEGVLEDEFYHETTEPKDNIILKLTTSRNNINVDNKIYLIMGVLE
ncbi:Ig-like domain-containing protein [Lysinibacillus fusiformis]|uniref:Ig-like domain-containing protein n=1 Tax=Lysinibacillus fusiformis TaxID=28031 RepID=UPI0037FCB0F0